MEKLFEQLSVYEVLNNFLPGAFFCILFRWQTGVGYEVNDTVTEILVFYFAGMIISRFGSLVLEPLCGKLRFVEKEAYGDYIKASKRDPKIETLSMKNNMYRTFAAAAILCGIAWAVQCIAEKSAVPRAVTIAGGWIALLVLLLAAYRKQNDYIRERIRACNKADALCFRYYDEALQRYVVGVYDGGLTEYGVALKEHLRKYYFNNDPNPKIDYVICSHPDQDHAVGLTEILENFEVGMLVMNRPWLYVDELFPKVYDGGVTKASLEKRLRESYPYTDALETLAKDKGIPIQEGFQGTDIDGHLTILSPSRDFYLQLLVESSKTPLHEDVHNLLAYIKNAIETWTNELIREDVETSAENESSIVVLGDMGEERFLLTGDAGIRALGAAADYAERNIYSLQTVKVQQIPYHGGRHNVSPSILNRVVGRIVPKGTTPTKTTVVSVAAGTDHPKKMVVNAYIRRGAKVYEARTSTLQHHCGDMPPREGWNTVDPLKFSEEVEDWKE